MIDVRDVVTVGGFTLGILGAWYVGGVPTMLLFAGCMLTLAGLLARPSR
jgi:hypothetical protein